MALVTTLAGVDSDSYATLAEADAYFAAHWDTVKSTAWDALSDGQKETALKQAIMILESFNYWEDSTETTVTTSNNLRKCIITPAETNQALSFPRNIDLDENDDLYIPNDVKNAQCEQAIFLVSSMNESTVQARARGLLAEHIKAGAVEVSQSYSSDGTSNAYTMFVSPIALMLLRKFIVTNKRVVRQ